MLRSLHAVSGLESAFDKIAAVAGCGGTLFGLRVRQFTGRGDRHGAALVDVGICIAVRSSGAEFR